MKKRLGYFSALLSPLDIGTLFYVFLSGLYIAIGAPQLTDILPHIIIRLGVIALIFVLIFLQNRYPVPIILFLRNVYPLIFLSFFYTETSYMKNIIFSNDLDIYFAALEGRLFGCQPSLVFSQLMPQPWFNELMNMFYFSYYLVTGVVCITLYMSRREFCYKPIFTAVFSFYLFYILYNIIPVLGPQYFFNTRLNDDAPPYLFGKIMHSILFNVEKPTGAFPSSHVGLALILSYLSYKHHKALFYITLPFVIGICFATIYLKEHYVIDVLAAMLVAPVFIYISGIVYNRLLLLNTPQKQNR